MGVADAFTELLDILVRDYAITDAQKDVDLNASVDEPASVIEADKQQIVTEAAERRAGSTPQRSPSASRRALPDRSRHHADQPDRQRAQHRLDASRIGGDAPRRFWRTLPGRCQVWGREGGDCESVVPEC